LEYRHVQAVGQGRAFYNCGIFLTLMLYLYFLALNVLEMLYESWISARNSRELIRRGAVEIAPFLLPVMIVIYAMMYTGSALEFYYHPRIVSFAWITTFALLFCAAKTLKFWAISTLGSFWTMRVLIVPKSHVVTAGPYRWIRHPNYVAVLAEIVATPLIGKCFVTLSAVVVLFSITLAFRIVREEDALKKHTDYSERMTVRRRFFP
jgi:methyltransferase